MNGNQVFSFFIDGTPFHDREYLGTVNQVRLNEHYAAVGFEGRAQLHLVRNISFHLWFYLRSDLKSEFFVSQQKSISFFCVASRRLRRK